MDLTAKNDTGSTELDWIQIKGNNQGFEEERFAEKIERKCLENPLVPIGALATVGALSYGIWCFYTRNRRMSQQMMRARIVAQAFTVISLVTGAVFTANTRSK